MSPFSKAKHFVNLDWSCFVGIFFFAMFFCWLLSLAFPQGLVNEETLTYWLLHKNFHWFSSNQLDWYRTIPYAALLGFAAHFRNPTGVLYWLNSFLFSLDCALVFWLGRILFASSKAGLALAASTVLFEVVAMRTFYNNLGVSTDALFGELIMLGVLLILVGWLKQNLWLTLSGYAAFGLLAFIKPAGITVWLIWLPFAVAILIKSETSLKQRYYWIALAFLLATGPLGFWCVRNYFIYGYPKSSGVGGCIYLQGVLPNYTPDERVFDDPKANIDFGLAVRICKADSLKRVRSDENEVLARSGLFERYFLYGPAAIDPFEVIAHYVRPSWNHLGYTDITKQDPHHMFEMDAQAGRIAWVIIKDHPRAYLDRVLREYVDMFSPLRMWMNPHYSFRANPLVVYAFWDVARFGPRPSYPGLYDGQPFPTGENSERNVAAFLAALHFNPITQSLLTLYYASEFWLSHIVFAAVAITLSILHFQKEKLANTECIRRICIVVAMMFLTVSSNFLLIASCHISKLRYQLAGDQLLHLIFLLSVPLLILAWQALIKKGLPSNKRLSIFSGLSKQILP